MRSTVRIDDDLMAALRVRAREVCVSMTRMLNRMLRIGLATSSHSGSRRERYREATVRMGAPRLGTDKALALVAALEDEEIIRKIALRK